MIPQFTISPFNTNNAVQIHIPWQPTIWNISWHPQPYADNHQPYHVLYIKKQTASITKTSRKLLAQKCMKVVCNNYTTSFSTSTTVFNLAKPSSAWNTWIMVFWFRILRSCLSKLQKREAETRDPTYQHIIIKCIILYSHPKPKKLTEYETDHRRYYRLNLKMNMKEKIFVCNSARSFTASSMLTPMVSHRQCLPQLM